MPKLLHLLRDQKLTDGKAIQLTKLLIYALLNQTSRQSDLLYFGQFIAAFLPLNDEEKSDEIIEMRNCLLKIVLQLMTRNPQLAINNAIQEELARILGFDWFLLFLQGSLHKDTVTIGLVNLMVLLSNPALYPRFKEGSSNGGWLKDTEAVLENRFGVHLLGFNMSSSTTSTASGTTSSHTQSGTAATALTARSGGLRIIRNDLLTLPGLQHLNWLMSHHIGQPKVYLVLFQALLGHYQNLSVSVLDSIETFDQLNLDRLWTSLFGEDSSSGNKRPNVMSGQLCARELTGTILSMIHALIWDAADCENFVNYPITLIQFLIYLYHNRKDFQQYCQSNSEFITALCQAIIEEEGNSNQTGSGSSGDNACKNAATSETPLSVLTIHSAKKVIMDFIRLIIVDTLSQPSAIRPISVFEVFLEGFSSCKLAQTELIASLMEQITSLSEVLQQQYDPTQPNLQQLTTTNIIICTSIIVDKLWQDRYLRDPKEIMDFEIKLLSRLKLLPPTSSSAKLVKATNIDMNLLYKSLNRTVLYLLSRPLETIAGRMAMLEILQRIHTCRQLILISPFNSDAEFYVCLTHCILQLVDESKINLAGKCGKTTWHVSGTESVDKSSPDEGALLVTSVAKKIWDEIYLSKKALIEDMLKISLQPILPPFGLTSVTPDISSLRETLYDPTLRVWVNYIESEQQKQRRKPGSSSIDSPSATNSPTALFAEKFVQINKFNNLVQRHTGFMTNIVGKTTGAVGQVGSAISTVVGVGSVARKEAFRNSTSDSITQLPIAPWTLMNRIEVQQWTLTHLSIINDLIELQIRQKIQSDQHLLKYVYDDWLATESELLIRERAIWGPEHGSQQFDKWKLDLTEGPHRMRKKLIRNEMFYQHYPYRPELDIGESKTLKYKLPYSFDSKEYYKRFRPENHNLVERDSALEIPSEAEDSPTLISANATSPAIVSASEFQGLQTSALLPINKSVSTDQDDQDGPDTSGFVDVGAEVNRPGSAGGDGQEESEQIETQTVLRLLEEGERISHMFRCARVQGLDTFEGLLLFGKEYFYSIDGFTLLKTREIRDIDSLPAK